MKVTQIEQQKRNPRRYNIYLDGTFVFGADEDLVVERRLVIGKEISSKDLEKIVFEAEVGKLMERMYRLFGIRMRSEKEVRDYLKRLSFKRKVKGQEELSGMAVELLVSKLKNKGLLNDNEFAMTWVNARSKKRGSNILKSELFKKGIDQEIIDRVISSLSIVGKEEEVAGRILEKRLERWHLLTYQEKKKKAYLFLQRRGFDFTVVKEVVDKYLKR